MVTEYKTLDASPMIRSMPWLLWFRWGQMPDQSLFETIPPRHFRCLSPVLEVCWPTICQESHETLWYWIVSRRERTERDELRRDIRMATSIKRTLLLTYLQWLENSLKQYYCKRRSRTVVMFISVLNQDEDVGEEKGTCVGKRLIHNFNSTGQMLHVALPHCNLLSHIVKASTMPLSLRSTWGR